MGYLPGERMKILYDYAMQFVGRPYHWGGDDPMAGFDCSGLVVELLQSEGAMPHGSDTTAQGLYNQFSKAGKAHLVIPHMGCLAYYGKGLGNITHVAFCLDAYRVIEAGGGGSKTQTEADAIKQNAFVRIRPARYRQDFLCFTSCL